MIDDIKAIDADLIARHPERGSVPTHQHELSRRWYAANAERKKATQKAQ